MNDMQKIESPFVRQEINGEYVVTPEIAEGYEWVFEDPSVMAVEKLDGTNVSVVMEEGKLISLLNRLNPKPFGPLDNHDYIFGIRVAYIKGRIPLFTGQYFGELMGPKIQKNFLKLNAPEWFPFQYLQKHCCYNSFHKYPRTFENISKWFQNDLFSLMYVKLHKEKVQPEGIVFTHPDGRMAKLRVDMFDWYKGKRHGGYKGENLK